MHDTPRSPLHRRLALAVPLAAVALLAAACGNDEPAPSTPPGTGPQANLPADAPPPPPAPMSSAPSAEASERTPATTPPAHAPRLEGDTSQPRSWSPVDVLRAVLDAQRRIHAAKLINEDVDATGEFGGLVELAGHSGGRMESVLREAYLARRLGDLNVYGQCELDGYLFAMLLPGRDGVAIAESQDGFGAGQLDLELAEQIWCMYAWPVDAGGGPAYFVSDEGEVLETEGGAYAGQGGGPSPGAALQSGGLDRIVGRRASREGQDGRVWRLAD